MPQNAAFFNSLYPPRSPQYLIPEIFDALHVGGGHGLVFLESVFLP